MIRLLFVAMGLLSSSLALAQEARFVPWDLILDSGDAQLAAYQVVVEMKDAEVTGIEGGSHKSFKEPPRYDPKALMGKRVILASFSLASDLPRGPVRFATLHMRQTIDSPHYDIRVLAAADPDGRPIDIKVQFAPRSPPGGNRDSTR